MEEVNTGAEAQENKAQESRAEDMLVTPFLEGNEPIILEGATADHNDDESASEGTEKPNKTTADISTIADFLNQGIEDDKKIKFDDMIFSGKNTEGNELPLDERKDMFIKTILDNTLLGPTAEVDSYIREVLKAAQEPNFDINTYRNNQKDIIDMPDMDTVVIDVFKQRYGVGTDANLSEDEIEDKVSELSVADKKMIYADFKQALLQVQKNKEVEDKRQQEDMFHSRLKKYNEDTKSSIDLLVEQSKVKDIFGGFKFGQADKEEYINALPDFMKREIEQNENKDYIAISKAEKELQKLLKDPASFLDLLPFLWLKSKGKLDGYSTMLSEKVKWDMIERLDNYSQTYGQSGEGKEHSIDDMLNVQHYLGN